MDQRMESMKVDLKVLQLESQMDPCSDQRRDGTKDLLWGTEMDQLKAQWMIV